MFLPGRKSEFLNQLGIKYGSVVVDGLSVFTALDQMVVEHDLKNALKDGYCTEEEMQETLMQAAEYLPKTAKEALKHTCVVKAPPPSTTKMSYVFYICSGPCTTGLHGHVVRNGENGRASEPGSTLMDGVAQLNWSNQKTKEISVAEAISVYMQMVRADLPIDKR